MAYVADVIITTPTTMTKSALRKTSTSAMNRLAIAARVGRPTRKMSMGTDVAARCAFETPGLVTILVLFVSSM